MAQLFMFSVLDMTAQQYGRPFYAVNDGSAVRSFTDEVNRPGDSLLYSHPNDFQLYGLGSFDDETGVVSVAAQPKLLVSGHQVADRTDPAKPKA